MREFDDHQKKRTLVSISRRRIDPNSIQGFILGYSDLWRSAISQLAKTHPLMILECEAGKEKEFFIGRVLKTTQDEVHFRHFSGAANWVESPARLEYKDITSCQVGANYLNVYQRYFERMAAER